MKKVMMALVVMLTASIVMAEEAAKVEAKTQDLTGKVAVIKDEAGALKAIELKVGDKSYTVKQDDKSKGLQELNNKNVKITGTLDEKGTTLTVVKFAAVTDEKKAEEKKVEEKK